MRAENRHDALEWYRPRAQCLQCFGVANFRTLRAWQHARALAVACGKVSHHFPGGMNHPLANQLLRACYSVPLNIAEGTGKKGLKEYRRFLNIARGSLIEVQAALDIARESGFISPDEGDRLD